MSWFTASTPDAQTHCRARRKLWTFNCGIHNCGTESGYMFLWSEIVVKRGACEIGSCLLKYLQNNNVESEELHIMSDNCKGQNKNWSLIALYVSLVQSGRFRFIYLHFLVVGHTRLPCDKDFCRIELHARKHCPIMYTVDAWADCIFNAGKRKMFCITRMQQSDFKNMNILLSVISKKTMTQAKDPIRFSEASVFKVSSTIPFVLEISY